MNAGGRLGAIGSATVGLLSLVVVLVGCSTEVAHGLDERSATRVAAELTARGVPAELHRSGRGQQTRYAVAVPSTESTRARQILAAAELPPRPDRDLTEIFSQRSVVPSPLEDQARMVGALQSELARSLEAVKGVLRARVHLSIDPRAHPFESFEDDEPTRASVLITYRGSEPPLSEDQVRALLSGAVADLAPERVTVIMVRRQRMATSGRCDTVQVGPFSVSPSSARPLKRWVLFLLAMVGLLALLLVGQTIRLRRIRSENDDRASGVEETLKS